MDIRNEVAVWIRKITPPLLGLVLLAALTAVPTMVEAQTLYSNQGEVQVTAQDGRTWRATATTMPGAPAEAVLE